VNLDRFAKSPAGRVVKVGRGESAYHAFVPHPLPPQFPWTGALVRRLSEADRALGELAGVGRSLSNPDLLIGPFIRREAVLSSRIEGTQTDLPHLYAYEGGQLPLPGLAPAPPEADVREVLNYVHALEYGLERVKTLPLSLRLLREMHERLLQGVRGERGTPGEFRTTQNWIGRPGCLLNDATFVPPPPDELMPALDALEKYLHAEDEHPPLVRLAFIHYQFEAIHPFLDGNGRIGRLLLSLLFVHWNLLPLSLLYLSAFFERRREDYYRLLLEVSASGTWSEWVHFFLDGAAQQAREAVMTIKRLQELQAKWREKLARKRAAANLLRLVDLLFETPFVTIPHVAKKIEVTYAAARNLVRQLVEKNVLIQMEDKTYGKTFVAVEVLEALSSAPELDRPLKSRNL
jgi:Fic family protein